jgi:hypothetical protein
MARPHRTENEVENEPTTQDDIQEAIRILREDAHLESNRRLEERLDRMEARLGRMPVQEMTAEEKAAEYDKLMAERTTPQGDFPHKEPEPEEEEPEGGPPPAPEAKLPPKKKDDAPTSNAEAPTKARRAWHETDVYARG